MNAARASDDADSTTAKTPQYSRFPLGAFSHHVNSSVNCSGVLPDRLDLAGRTVAFEACIT